MSEDPARTPTWALEQNELCTKATCLGADDCRDTSGRHLRLKKIEDSRREILLVEAP